MDLAAADFKDAVGSAKKLVTAGLKCNCTVKRQTAIAARQIISISANADWRLEWVARTGWEMLAEDSGMMGHAWCINQLFYRLNDTLKSKDVSIRKSMVQHLDQRPKGIRVGPLVARLSFRNQRHLSVVVAEPPRTRFRHGTTIDSLP
jgi:hypothetical protein